MTERHDTIVAIQSANLVPALAAFVAVVNAGSFTRAARLTGSDKTVMSRKVRRLEDALEVRLLHRTTRSMQVTEAGRLLLDKLVGPLGEVLIGLAEAANPETVAGEVRVATLAALSEVWGTVAAKLRAQHPELSLTLQTSDAVASLVDEGFDLAIRGGHLPDSSMIARKIAHWRYVLVSSPAWLEANGPLTDPSQVADHWVLYGGVARARHWEFERGDTTVALEVRPVLTVPDGHMIRGAVRAGVGVGALPPYLIEEDLDRGRLVQVLPEWRSAHVLPLWAVRPHRNFIPARVQAVLDLVEEVLGEESARWDARFG